MCPRLSHCTEPPHGSHLSELVAPSCSPARGRGWSHGRPKGKTRAGERTAKEIFQPLIKIKLLSLFLAVTSLLFPAALYLPTDFVHGKRRLQHAYTVCQLRELPQQVAMSFVSIVSIFK